MPDPDDGKLEPDLGALADRLQSAIRDNARGGGGGSADGGGVAGRVAEMEQAIQGLRREVASLRMRAASAEGPLGGKVYLAKSDGTNLANWQEHVPGSNNADLTPFVSGRAGTIPLVDPQSALGGAAHVTAVLQLRNGSNTAHVRIGGDRWIRVKLTAATQDGSNKRWKYSGVQVVKSAQGYGAFGTVTGGITFPTSSQYDYVYNNAEDMNGASGIYGNGVSSTNLSSTSLNIVPFPTNRVVWVRVERPTGAGTLPEGWFEGDNAIDGSC